MAAMMALALGWLWQGESLSVIWRRDRALAYRQNTSMDTTARVGVALLHPDGQLGSVLGNVTLSDSFVTSASNSTSSATVSWGGHSLRYPMCNSFSNYENLFGNGEAHSSQPKDHIPSGNKYGNVPLAGYDSELILQSSDDIPLTPGQLLVCQQGMGGADHVAVYQQTFPFAAYAPQGAVQLDSCWAWQNPTMEQSEKDPRQSEAYPYASGLPVLVRAGGKIQIDGDFPCGSATSSSGPVLLPEKSTAMGFTGLQPDDNYCQNLTVQVQNAMTALSQGNMDKNQWIKGKGLSVAGFRDLINGGDWQAFLTVQQACGFPIPLYPTMAFDEPLVEIVMIHHPFPADFSTGGNPADADKMQKLVARLKEISDRMTELTDKLIPGMKKTLTDLDAEIEEIKLELARANDKDKPSIQDRLNRANKERGVDQDKLKALAAELSKLKQEVKDIQAQLKEIQSHTTNGQEGDIPQSAWADATAGKGSTWAYLKLGKQVLKGFWDIIKGQGSKAFDDLVPPTRLVHFGAMNPEWDYEDPGYTMKSTVNVPAGKTLKLGGGPGGQSRQVHIKGDLWIQRGATCFVDGDLEISKPPSWSDFKGVGNSPNIVDPSGDDLEPTDIDSNAPDGSANPFYPWGRVILEEGATLVVSGNLVVSGGSRDTGSVVCCSKIGGNRAINTAILCRGNLTLTNGVYAGVSMEDLIGRLAIDDGSLKGFYQQFLDPFLNILASNVCKVAGPWDDRNSYFAEHATTFVFMNFLAEFGLAEIPWPIPLPVPNKDSELFESLSTLYSYELNFNLGENLYTQCPWWLLGRGIVPVTLKVPPAAVAGAFNDINYSAIAKDAVLEALKSFLEEIIPDIIKVVIQEFVVKVIEEIITEAIPWKWPGKTPIPEGQNVAREMAKKLTQELSKILTGEVKKQLKRVTENLVVAIKNDIMQKAGGNLNANYLTREVPGVMLYSGGDTRVGPDDDSPVPLTASGFFYSEGSLSIKADRIVGCLVSHRGSIKTSGILLYYPFFSQVSLYNPPKPADYKPFGVSIPSDTLRNALQMTIPIPSDTKAAIDLGYPQARVTTSGFIK